MKIVVVDDDDDTFVKREEGLEKGRREEIF